MSLLRKLILWLTVRHKMARAVHRYVPPADQKPLQDQ